MNYLLEKVTENIQTKIGFLCATKHPLGLPTHNRPKCKFALCKWKAWCSLSCIYVLIICVCLKIAPAALPLKAKSALPKNSFLIDLVLNCKDKIFFVYV